MPEKYTDPSVTIESVVSSIPSQPSTISTGGRRIWIHPFEVRGQWQRLRNITSVILLVILYGAPWVYWNNEPFIRLSFLSESFILFGSHILMYEFYHFALLALLLIVSLFLASMLWGRVWCGYACPQTVFIEQILGRIERLVEGDAAHRLAVAKKPWNTERRLRCAVKHLLYILVGLSFAFTLVAVFTGVELLLYNPSRGAWTAVVLLTALAWFDGGYWREQFCHIACPYARFQSVMQDSLTRSIGYDAARGEIRGRTKSSGDCIDCGLCVRVCPSAIDIRNGAMQQECIGCARCIDACDSVMDKLGRSPGLIRYDVLRSFSAKKSEISSTESTSSRKSPWVRPRLVAYSAIWVAIFAIGLCQFLWRDRFHLRVFSIAGQQTWIGSSNGVKNLFAIKVGNQHSEAESFDLVPTDPSNVKVINPVSIGPIEPGAIRQFSVLIEADRSVIDSKVELALRARSNGETKKFSRKIIGSVSSGGN